VTMRLEDQMGCWGSTGNEALVYVFLDGIIDVISSTRITTEH